MASIHPLSPEFNEMTGFTEEEVRAMLDYYATTCEFHHSTDELIEAMKPWYDNYCFAEKSYGSTTMYNSNIVLYFVDNYIRNEGNMPRNMIEENIRVDYNKLRMLIRKDKEFAHDASTIQTLVQQGYITGELKTGFPAEAIAEPDNFVSLLFYFGMLTISGTKQGETLLTIPNQVVREQLYSISEQDNQEGYADIFMFPLLEIYKDMLHSYIIELKYAKGKDSNEKVEQLRREAITQAERYAASEPVQKAIGTTTLHKIVVVYRGMKMEVCEEISE